MGIFGWSYPAGAANDPAAPWNQDDAGCEVCGLSTDDCRCKPCPVCTVIGRPECAHEHGAPEPSDPNFEGESDD